MPHADSKYFGRLEFQLVDLFHFPRGLPGFEQETEFFAVSVPGQEPVMYLQSRRTPDFCLITLPARVCCHKYLLDLSAEERDLLGIPAASVPLIGVEIACQAIVTMDESHEPVANLAAPLVLNLLNRLGTQSFQADSDYSFRHLLSSTLATSPACL